MRKTEKTRGLAALLLCMCIPVLAGCGGTGGNNPTSSTMQEADSAEKQQLSAEYKDATVIRMDGKTVDAVNNVQYQKNTLYIVSGGTYVLRGNLLDSVIEVNAGKKEEVCLVLDNVSLSNEKGPVLHVQQAKSVTIVLPEGTVNTMISGDSSNVEKADGVIYSKDDLILTGSGTLNITTGYKHGIVANDTLKIEGGIYTIEAPQDGLHVNDRIDILGGSLDITVGDDAIHANNDEGTGQLFIAAGDICISQCYEGLEAHEIVIDGGNIHIMTSDDGINGAGDRTACITINGGDITILHEEGRDGDGLDSNGSIAVNGGRMLISMNDATQSYALDCDGGITLTGGTVLACGSAGMAECFDSDATQGFIQKNVTGAAGTVVTLKDAAGKVLFTEKVPYAFSNMVLTVPELKVGDSCTLQIGENAEEVSIDNSKSGRSGGFGGNRGQWGQPGAEPPGDNGRQERAKDQRPGENAGKRPENADGQKPDGFPGTDNGQQPPRDFNGEMPQRPDGEMPPEPPGEGQDDNNRNNNTAPKK